MYDKTHYNKKKKKKENASKFERSKINLCLQMEKKKVCTIVFTKTVNKFLELLKYIDAFTNTHFLC